MFNRWFKPTCPVDIAAKMWIERRMQWLCDEFGRDVMTKRAVILPNDEFFPDPFGTDEKSVRRLLDRVCGYMDVSPRMVRMEMFANHDDVWLVNEAGHALPKAGGTFSTGGGDDGSPGDFYGGGRAKPTIAIERSETSDPGGLIATMAHELAHVRLLWEERLSGDEFDNELLTDLTAVFHGFGIFLANSPRNWRADFSTWPGTGLARPEYMSPPMFGYALALAAWARGEAKPGWARYVRGDSRACFKQGLRFLQATGDSRFGPAPG